MATKPKSAKSAKPAAPVVDEPVHATKTAKQEIAQRAAEAESLKRRGLA
jgi:hypothetical protein